MGPMWWGPLSREECGELGRVALAAAFLKHPRQSSSVPFRKHGQGSGKEQGWRWGARMGASRCVWHWLWPASPSALSLPLYPLGVPLLFVIPWGIVKYLYEDEG